MKLRNVRIRVLADRCPSISAVILLVVVSVIYHISVLNDRWNTVTVNFNDRTLPCQTRKSSSSWYGLSAYPTVKGPHQSWTWIQHFLNSIPHGIPDDAVKGAFPVLSQRPTVNSVRLDSENTSAFEDIYLEQHLQIKHFSKQTYAVPRYDCSHLACLARRRNLPLRSPVIAATDNETVLLHGLMTDLYDLRRLVASLSDHTRLLIIAITAVPSTVLQETVKAENLPSSLYNFLQYVYFHYNWIPVHSLQLDSDPLLVTNCRDCKLWITWKRWNLKEPVKFFPPAGDGSYEMELRRLASFILQPQRDACNVLQKFGGNSTLMPSNTFVDGQYVVCLDGLIPALQANTCLVYSFGILNDWSFDGAMQATGCEVHSFDPSIGLPEHQRAPHHWFHPWGLTNHGLANGLGWELLSFLEIRRRLKHTGREITVLKMDAESAEWSFLNDTMKYPAILESINQLTFETHAHRTGNVLVRQRALLLHYLERRGFRLFNSRQNILALDLRAMHFEQKLTIKSSEFLHDLSFVRC